jgi:glycosyltransferase involved in cell wall biosynthesis
MSMRNNAATVQAAVRSVQLQTLGDWELVMIDDGSSDESSSIVSAFDDDRIRLIRESSSAGLAARLNQAVALSRGEFIARMDADDICFPDRLAQQVARLRQQSRIDVLAGSAVVFADDARLLGELPVGRTHEEVIAQPFRGFPFPHPTWCGRTHWFRQNPYDPKLMKAQDQDLLLRTYRSSSFAALDEVLIAYRQNALDLTKMLSGRRVFIASLWVHAQRSGEFLPAVRGIASQLFKGGADIATVGLGFNRLAQRQRLRPVRPAVTKRWQELRQQLGLAEGKV